MRIRHGLAIALLAMLAAPLTVSAADAWRLVTTEHFRVLSQANDGVTAKWIRDFEQYIASTSDALGIKPRALPPLTMILFSRDKNYTPYKLKRPDGKPANVAGQFVTLGGISSIAMALDSEKEDARRTIFHEATHWLTSIDPNPQPTWFTEGIAEMLSTFEQAGSKVNWAKPIDEHLAQMQDQGVLPLAEFLTRVDALQDQDKIDDRYYAQCWAFVHFLMLSGDKSRTELLTRFLTVYQTKSGDETVREVFGPNLDQLQRDFTQYVNKATYSFLSVAAKPVADPPASVPAPPAVVEAALGMMALAMGDKALAKQHAKRAIEASSDLPDGHQLLAYIARDDNDYAAAGAHAEAALKAGSRDSEMHMLMADALISNSQGNFGDTLTTRIGHYQQALALRPTRHDTYQQLAGDLLFLDKPEAAHQQILEQGQRLYRNDEWIKVSLATVKTRLGTGNDALQVIDQALRPGNTLTDIRRRNLTTVRRNMLMQSMDAELKAAQQTNDLAAARAIIARYRQVAGDDADILSYLQRRDSQFELSQLVDRMNAAMSKRNAAELNPIFDQILAHPGLTPDLKAFVENARRNLK
jgi:tetratricopeptide (TPR) repeat protein